jgi:hypothetical protein
MFDILNAATAEARAKFYPKPKHREREKKKRSARYCIRIFPSQILGGLAMVSS